MIFTVSYIALWLLVLLLAIRLHRISKGDGLAAPAGAAAEGTDDKRLDLSRFLRQPVKTQLPLNGELCHGVVTTNVHA